MSQKRRALEAGLSQSDPLLEASDASSSAASLGATPSSSRSSPIADRGSTFIGVFSKSDTVKQLQGDPAFRLATHRIAAWRHLSRQRSLTPHRPVYETGSDDDGEKYAGKRLEKLLITLDVCGALVVARWYGGVLLGPVRFDHIENCAREAIERCQALEHEHSSSAKRPRLAAESPAAASQRVSDEKGPETLQKRLSVIIERRDESISALRDLLAEKQNRLVAPSKTSTAAKGPKYSDLSVETLQRLEKARDSTIAWLLKEIDRAEVDSSHPHDKRMPSTMSNASEGQFLAAEKRHGELAESKPGGLEASITVKSASLTLGIHEPEVNDDSEGIARASPDDFKPASKTATL